MLTPKMLSVDHHALVKVLAATTAMSVIILIAAAGPNFLSEMIRSPLINVSTAFEQASGNILNEDSSSGATVTEAEELTVVTWYHAVISYLPDFDYRYWLSWLLTPIALSFLLPLFLLLLIYASSFIVFA